ncbi:NADH-quinone oxidoreductase subunit N [Fimbriiglobus ruber]|uniref:NADH-quinone oxidoreductase subunit N n=1 Tax=Fimbriiglobus ruber TaxID=1908690 RepID=A0A225DVP5_9BACT|nr:NADH-quinone oxidoreductase subunit N [Fimbriiglobus ruber]OWK41706.1 NADH-ubiquinone oxidoreductase chain N [Fimbriiglobus ruber]
MFLTPDQFADLRFDLALDLRRFAPELVVSATIILLLLARMFPSAGRVHLGGVALGGTMAALLGLLAPALGLWPPLPDGPAFSGLLALDPLAAYLRGLLLAFAVLAVVLTRLTGIPDADDAADFYTLLLGGTLGMMVMVSANHLLMVFVGIEMASLPSYALSGFLKGKKRGSEAALKYVVYGAAASGFMLYGISLLVAALGTGHLPTLAAGYAHALHAGGFPLPLAAGTLLVLVGLGFKLGAVPFHFWLPDVFEGAAAEVGAFLSVASKAAAVGLTARFLLALQAAVAAHGADDPATFLLLPKTIGLGLLVAAALTATLGNLVALAQTNLKRLLAYSTIAHAGYMLMALATMTKAGTAAVLFYLAAYLLMNLGAFAVVAFVRNHSGGDETIAAVRGLLVRSPALTAALTVFLLSLLGLPPLAGFAGKFQVFAAVFDAGRGYALAGASDLGIAFYVLLGIGIVNTVVSAGYYLRILRAAGLDDPVGVDEKGEPVPLGESSGAALYVCVLAAALVALGIWWGPLADLAARAVRGM